MNSMEEDALFKEYGWEKDLIQRIWISPVQNMKLSFDTLMDLTAYGRDGQVALEKMIKQFGRIDEQLHGS